MKLWEYIEGSIEIPPIIPKLRPARRIQGPDEHGNIVVIHDDGNQLNRQSLVATGLDRFQAVLL
jgi:hypothetical protein